MFMLHEFLVITVNKRLESVYIYGSYRKIKTGVSLIGVLQMNTVGVLAAVTKFPTNYFCIEHGRIHGLKCGEWYDEARRAAV